MTLLLVAAGFFLPAAVVAALVVAVARGAQVGDRADAGPDRGDSTTETVRDTDASGRIGAGRSRGRPTPPDCAQARSAPRPPGTMRPPEPPDDAPPPLTGSRPGAARVLPPPPSETALHSAQRLGRRRVAADLPCCRHT